MHTNLSKLVFVILFLSVVFSYGVTSHAKKNPINIVFILADDLGYSDVGYMNQKPEIETPNIDKLAKNGMVFTNAYAACPVCSPTRASILTGKYPATLQLTCHIPGIGIEKYITKRNEGKRLMEAGFIDHLPLSELTFAEVLKENGYKTAFMGKWHLAGEGSQKTIDGVVNASLHPDQQGFDVNIGGCAYGQPANYFSPYKNATITDGPEKEYLTDRLGNEACRFIESNKNEPFLLYLSFYTVHSPLQALAKVIEKYNGNKYYAMIDKLDENVGKVLDKISDLGLKENTLFVFYSDNGGTRDNPPLQDKKGSLYEGGIRVPLIFSLHGIIPKGTTCDEPVTSPDFFPTLIDATKLSSKKYKTKQLEGISFWNVLTKNKVLPQRAIYWHYPHHRGNKKSMAAAVRDGDWKLIYEFESEEISLYNLKDDVGEKYNLANKYPDKTKLLHLKLKEWQLKVKASMPKSNPNYKKGK